jgi:hypothetical protein
MKRILNQDHPFVTLFRWLMPSGWGYVEQVRVGLDVDTFVRIHFIRR